MATEGDIRRALDEYADARDELHQLMRDAYAQGWSLRKIAEVAGVSHEHVRRIVSQ